MNSKKQIEYPKCPRCDGPTSAAMMTSNAVNHNGTGAIDLTPQELVQAMKNEELFYHPSAISIYCRSGSCNFDFNLNEACTRCP